MKKTITTCLMVILVSGYGCAPIPDRAKLTIKAVDEDGKPLAGFSVNASFVYGTKFKGVTDKNGLFVLDGRAGAWDASYGITNDGYYESVGGYKFSKPIDGKWQPWNPVITSVVRRIVNPIPLYAKYIDTKIPAENTELGFDLIMGDWIAPYGRGQVADFVFYFSRRISGDRDYEGTLKLAFTRPNDGILENKEIYLTSNFQLPRYAPQDNYATNWCYRLGEDPKSGYFGLSGDGRDKSFFFRVRSICNEYGKFKEALYGKIAGAIRVGGVARSTGADVIFKYYLNPTPSDRNLEFDPKRNLLKALKSTEEVTAP